MKVFTPEVKVGLFTILAGVALMYLSFKTAGVSMFGAEQFMTFNMRFDTVAGVDVKSKVKLSGVEIGYIEDIILENTYATVKARLTRQAEIRKDAIATIRTSGLLGEKYIEIIQGSPDQPLIKDNGFLENTQEPSDISDMLNKLGEALEDVKAITSTVRSVFGTMEGEKAMKNILNNLDNASANVKAVLQENRAALKATLDNFSNISGEFAKNAPAMSKNLDKVAAGLREIIEQNKENLAAGMANIRELSEEFKNILKENRANLRKTMTNISAASDKVDAVLASANRMSKSMEKVASDIKEGKGTIGKLITEEETYNELNSALKDAGKFFDKYEDLRLSLGFRAERQFELDDTKSFVSLKIEPREDKYYLLEISEDIRRYKDLSSTRNTLNSLLYTAVLAKRFSDITLKAGLYESSAGAGIDYHMMGERLLASAEFFNLGGYDDDSPNPQVKARIMWYAHKYIFFYLGGDELLNDYYRTFFLGGGIMFDESDLKSVVGLVY